MNHSLADFIKRHIFLDIAFAVVSMLIVPSLLGLNLFNGAFIELGWCEVGQNICLLMVYGKIIFAVSLIAVFFQFVLPIIIRRYRKWANNEKTIRLEIDKDFRHPYQILFVRLTDSIFVWGVSCSIKTFPSLSELSGLKKGEMQRIEDYHIRLPIGRYLWFWSKKRVNIFILNKKEQVFSVFGGEKYSRNPSFGFGNHLFGIRFSGRNILGREIFHQIYLFVEYKEKSEYPEVQIKKIFEISKDEREIIKKYENRHVASFL